MHFEEVCGENTLIHLYSLVVPILESMKLLLFFLELADHILTIPVLWHLFQKGNSDFRRFLEFDVLLQLRLLL